jgi:hypothetical protein
MSTLGNKIKRRAQVLGKKFESKAQMLGSKANQYLKIGDSTLRKAENTLQNKLLPIGALLAPEMVPEGAVALGAIKSMRSQTKPLSQTADRLEKLNLRKEASDLANRLAEQGGVQNSQFV